jgi:hypothetical protein
LPVQPRPESLAAIGAALTRIAARIRQTIPGAAVTEQASEGAVIKLFIRADQVQVLIEVTPVIRGCLYPAELRTVSAGVEEIFGFAEMPVCSFADLYAGKLVASLDRQHPRLRKAPAASWRCFWRRSLRYGSSWVVSAS